MARLVKPDASLLSSLHARLIAEDPTAPAELAELAHAPLVEALLKSTAGRGRHQLATDAASDALIEYIKKPDRFNPAKRGLWGYLVMAAKADLLNALDREKTASKREKQIEGVEDAGVGRNRVLSSAASRADAQAAEIRAILAECRDLVDRAFPDAQDRNVIDLMTRGVASTQPYAAELGLEHLSLAEQRLRVKQAKDRIQKKLRRLGENHDE